MYILDYLFNAYLAVWIELSNSPIWLLFYAWDVKAKEPSENSLSFFLCTEPHRLVLFTDGERG